MRVCAGCSFEYQEDFKFCPDCGRGFGSAGDSQVARLNSGLSQLARSASSERVMETRRQFSGQPYDAAKQAGEILTAHDPMFRGLVNDG